MKCERKINERLLEAIGNIDDALIYNAITDTSGKKKYLWMRWAAVAACLCLVVTMSVIFMRRGGAAVTAYAYGTEEALTAAGAIMSTGTISDAGEMTGHPLMFFLSGENIASVRFSCKNQMINFMDWTEKRDEYGNAKNFTVPYGADENEYHFLLIDWVPVDTIRELTGNEESTIATLPAVLREDVIVMEITFVSGKTITKAIHISLQDDGTFFATFDDYTIRKTDDFVERADSEVIPREILYGKTVLSAAFYDKNQKEIFAEALWYNMANVDHILVKWTGETPNTVRLLFTPAGTETAEQMQLVMTRVPLDGDNEITLSLADLDKTNMYGHLQIELEYGERKTTADYNVFYDTENQMASEQAEPETKDDAVDDILLKVQNHYKGKGFVVLEQGLLEYSFTEATLEVTISEGGVMAEEERMVYLQCQDDVWKVIGEEEVEDRK